MRRTLTTLAVVSVLFAAGSALAKDDPPPPPPPPPPPSDTTTTDDKKSDDTSSSSNSTDFHSTDALFDVSKGKKRPMMLSFFLNIPYPNYFGSLFAFELSARFNIPLVHDGFVPQINDSLDLEFGADIIIIPGVAGTSYSPIAVLPIIEPRYTVYLLPKLAVYVKPLNIGVLIWPSSVYSSVYFHYSAALGVIFKLTDSIYLRGELGSYAIRAGIGIAF